MGACRLVGDRPGVETLRRLRVAEVKELDVALDENGAKTYRAKLSVSFKYEGGD